MRTYTDRIYALLRQRKQPNTDWFPWPLRAKADDAAVTEAAHKIAVIKEREKHDPNPNYYDRFVVVRLVADFEGGVQRGVYSDETLPEPK